MSNDADLIKKMMVAWYGNDAPPNGIESAIIEYSQDMARVLAIVRAHGAESRRMRIGKQRAMIDIAPCPWCSSVSVWCYAKNDGHWVACVRAATCRAHGPVAKSRFEAIAAWNRVVGWFNGALASLPPEKENVE